MTQKFADMLIEYHYDSRTHVNRDLERTAKRTPVRARLSRCPIRVWTIVGCVAVGAVLGVGTMMVIQVIRGV